MISSQGGSMAIVSILDQLPAAGVVVFIFALIALVFSVTTYDSASYILASADLYWRPYVGFTG